MAKRARPGSKRAKASRRATSRVTGRAAQGRVRARSPARAATELPPPARPPAEATAAFEQAMTAMQRHAYAAAAGTFRGLLDEYPKERAILDRARVYLDLCERELRKASGSPASSLEERMTAATAALNNDDEREAERLARSVLAEEAGNELALYLLAALEARRGMTEEALTLLSQAIALSPDAGALARHDDDFSVLHDTEAFRELTEPPAASPAGRRSRRSRAER